MKDLPKPVEPLIVSSVSQRNQNDEISYRGHAVSELLRDKRTIEEVVWLLWTGKLPSKIEAELARTIIVMVADHSPGVAGAYATILAASAGLYMPQAVAAGVQMIGPRFGGAAGMAAEAFKQAVDHDFTVEQFEDWAKKTKGWHTFPGIGHKIFSRSRPDSRVAELKTFAKKNLKQTAHLDFAVKLEEALLKKNEKLILNVDGAIGAILMDVGFPLEGVDGFFILSRTIGLIAHYIDQKERGTGLIRLPEELVMYKQK